MKKTLVSIMAALALSGCVAIPAGQPIPEGTTAPVVVLPPTQVILSWPPAYIGVWPYGYWTTSPGGPWACPWPYSCWRPRPGVPPPRHLPPGWIP